MSYKMSIIIPTYVDYEKVKSEIEEIEQTATGEYEIIATCQKQSASKNRNYGIDKSKYDTIIMLDDDITDMTEGWNERLAQTLEMENVIMAAPRLLNPDGTIGLMIGEGSMNIRNKITYSKTKVLPAATICFKKTEIRFDENYEGAGFEDTDFCFQMNEKYPNGLYAINNEVKLTHINEMKLRNKVNKKYFFNKWNLDQKRFLEIQGAPKKKKKLVIFAWV